MPDEVLFHEGRPADTWWVLLEGTVSLVRQVGKEETALGAMTQPGQWAGGFRAWDEHGVYFATGRATSSGRVFAVSATVLRDRADAWFPFGVHFIKGLVNTVRRIEAGARQRESLVALGTLAAGLAHEINNPASSATRSVDALEGTSESLMSALGRLAEGQITADQFVALDQLRREAAPKPATLDALTLADNEEILSDWLTAHGVEDPWLIAPALAGAGMDVAWCEKVVSVLGEGPLAPALEWVASSLSMTALLAEVKDATHRISDLVAAVREYSQLDRASVQTINVTEGLESTLVMFGYRLRRDIKVERDFDPELPRIEAIPGELNQVWTNLIANALDAMDGTGTLRLTTRVDDAGLGRRGDRRHRAGNAGTPAGARLRAVLHHQGRRGGHRPRSGHLAPDHRRPAQRRDHHRLGPRQDGSRRSGCPRGVRNGGNPAARTSMRPSAAARSVRACAAWPAHRG